MRLRSQTDVAFRFLRNRVGSWQPHFSSEEHRMSLTGKPDDPTTKSRAPIERLAFRIDEVARTLGISRRLLERQISAGKFPKADVRMGRCPLWKTATVREWIDKGGK
jgi:predicted DNA-binding transcriptional regulator AlpA